jgi:hypothetical protein
MQPTHIYHADWGTDPSKRWLARAKLGLDGRHTAEAPRPVGDHAQLITSIRSEIGSEGCALVGFDFPIGVPERYASAAEIEEFKPFLLELGTGAWADFFTVSRIAAEITIHRPFYPFRPGGTQQAHVLKALGLQHIDDLRRQCERKQIGRRAACGYDACNRLQGFGLAHEIELSPRQVPVGEYCFRPSIRGLKLLKLVGEEVANADKYHL